MKVLHIVDSFSPLSETFIYDYITELERQGVDNHVLTFNRVNEDDRPFSKVYTAKIKRDFIFFVLRVIAHFNNKPNKWWAIRHREIKKIVKKVKPDIIHAHFGPMGVLVSKIANNFHIPLIVSFHGYDASMLLRNDYWVKQYEKLNKCVKAITVISNNMTERLKMFDSNKLNVIHVGKYITDYTYDRQINSVKNFISVGRLSEKKGHLDLINAFSLVVKEYDDISLTIIGEGHLREELIKLIKQKKLESKIKLLGSVRHKDVIEFYKKSDSFILTSKTASNGDMEGIPTVLMEAQAFLLPVISTRHSGIPECIPKENHKFLAEEGNIEQIKNCILNLIKTDKEELKKIVERGRKKIEKEFNLEIEVSKLIDIYKKNINI